MHWNLPSNPVDLEQREGRVHRYKGHAVRKNVARDYSPHGDLLDVWPRARIPGVSSSRRPGAPETDEQSDLVPFWVYTTEGGAHIERHLPMIPLSKDVDRAEVLRRSLAVYRMAFGQSRQDDLVQYLQRYLTAEQITAAVAELRIDLTPELSPNRHKSGVLQAPGELAADEPTSEQAARLTSDWRTWRICSIASPAIRPVTKTVSVDALERLIEDFVALRSA